MDSLTYFKGLLAQGEFEKLQKFDSIGDLLEYCHKSFPKDIAIKWSEGEKIISKTYEEMYLDIAHARSTLNKLGIQKGDNVGIMFRNEYGFIVSFFAVATLGAVSANIPVSIPSQAIFGLSHKFNLKAIIYTSEIQSKIDEAQQMGMKIILIKEESLLDKDTFPINVHVNKKDPACIVFTGGTTGAPKGALLSHDNLTRGSLNGCYICGHTFHQKYVSLIPFTHVFGLVRNLLSIFQTGSSLMLVKEPATFVKDSAAMQPDVMVLVPALANLVYNIVRAYGKGALGGKLNYIICGGAVVSPELIKNLDSVGILCCAGYGLTETANLVSGSCEGVHRASSVGLPYPEQQLKVVNGELYTKGDNVFMGYYNDPEATKEVFDNGWLKTGDLVKFDDDGFLYIIGRSKNVIVFTSGQKVSPEVIEASIDRFPLIGDSIVSLYEDNAGEFLQVQIYPNPKVVDAMKLNKEQVKQEIGKIIEKVNDDLVDFEKIQRIIIRDDDFPRSPAMKILRGKC